MKVDRVTQKSWGMISLSLMIIPFLLTYGLAYADNATVLPEGVWRFSNETAFFLPVDERYDEDGNKVDIADPFNANLTPLVPPLPPNPFLGVPADIGSSDVDLKLHQTETTFTPAYGVTDRLSIGIIVRYLFQSSDIDASVDSSAANTGTSPFLISPANPIGLGAPCFTVGCTTGGPLPGTAPLTLDNVQTLAKAAGFKELKDWNESGFGDTDIGARYQYFRSDQFRAATTFGIRAPTGATDDPDNLLDREFGVGAWALLFQLQQDLLFQKRGTGIAGRLGFPAPGSWYLNTEFVYELYLPDSQEFRVCPASNPICATTATLNRHYGDIIQAEFSPTIGLLKGVIFTGIYRFKHKFEDSFSGAPPGVDVTVLEKNSDSTRHEFQLVLNFTSIPWVVEKKFPVPFVLAFQYRDRFDGTNALDSQFFGFSFTVYGK